LLRLQSSECSSRLASQAPRKAVWRSTRTRLGRPSRTRYACCRPAAFGSAQLEDGSTEDFLRRRAVGNVLQRRARDQAQPLLAVGGPGDFVWEYSKLDGYPSPFLHPVLRVPPLCLGPSSLQRAAAGSCLGRRAVEISTATSRITRASATQCEVFEARQLLVAVHGLRILRASELVTVSEVPLAICLCGLMETPASHRRDGRASVGPPRG